VKENEVPAECGKAGSYESVVYCTVCEAEISRETVPTTALEHEWSETGVYTEATYEADAFTTYPCVHGCGATNVVTHEGTKLEEHIPAKIEEQPKDVTVQEYTDAVFTINVSGNKYTLQWQYSMEGEYWYNTSMPGNTTETLTVRALPERDGWYYRCNVRDEGKLIRSITVQLSITGDPTKIVVTKAPESATVVKNANAVFTVEATKVESYQWQYSKDGGETWYNTTLPGATTDTMTVTAYAERADRQYRCVMTDAQGRKVISAVATLTIAAPITYKEVADQNVALYTNAVFSVEATGEGLTYKWQYSKDDGETWYNTTLPGVNTEAMTVTAYAERDLRQYRCIITDAYGNVVITNTATLDITDVE
jgi:hypothetical protein